MEAFVASFCQHASALVSLQAMKWVNTGDRIADTTIQMLLSTIVAGLVACLVAFSKDGSLFSEFMARLALACRMGGVYDPVRFRPSLANGKPANGLAFLYRADLNLNRAQDWFMHHHGDKLFVLMKQTSSFVLCEHSRDSASKLALDTTLLLIVSEGVILPVWRHVNGHWVYITRLGSCMHLVSDCANALKAVMASIRDFAEASKGPAADEKDRLYVFESTGSQRRTAGRISLNKTLECLFFTEKPQVSRMLMAFKTETLFPKHLPVDNKLGILLHGPPGTGKTMFVAALANFLGRSLLIVDLKRVTTRTMFEAVLSDPKTYILVFEELDTVSWARKRCNVDVVEASGSPMDPSLMLMMMSAKDSSASSHFQKEMDDKKDTIDLGYVLRKLDGLESGDGRIIVATTNHPEDLDDALLRPGRFGLHIRLTRATQAMVADIVGFIYQVPLSVEDEDVQAIPAFKWSPAEILQESHKFHDARSLLHFLQREAPLQTFA